MRTALVTIHFLPSGPLEEKLCDVRRSGTSRNAGFKRLPLRIACAGSGIRYEHLPELGIASDQRQELNTQADYDALFAAYEREYLPRQRTALDKIRDWVVKGERGALTCFERLPQHCHRHCVAEALERLGATSRKTHHL